MLGKLSIFGAVAHSAYKIHQHRYAASLRLCAADTVGNITTPLITVAKITAATSIADRTALIAITPCGWFPISRRLLVGKPAKELGKRLPRLSYWLSAALITVFST
jgi:hypothetical protein